MTENYIGKLKEISLTTHLNIGIMTPNYAIILTLMCLAAFIGKRQYARIKYYSKLVFLFT
jgi:hypothetical protein